MFIRLYATILCDRELKDKMYFSPGGYVINLDGKEIQFDFGMSEWKWEGKRITWVQKDFDESYSQTSDETPVSKKEFVNCILSAKEIMQFKEFHIYPGEDYDPVYIPVKVEEAIIEIMTNDGELKTYDLTASADKALCYDLPSILPGEDSGKISDLFRSPTKEETELLAKKSKDDFEIFVGPNTKSFWICTDGFDVGLVTGWFETEEEAKEFLDREGYKDCRWLIDPDLDV